MPRTPSRTPLGSGRGGARRSASKSGLKRRTSIALSALEGISKNDYKRLARRAGVKRISAACFDVKSGIPVALRGFLRMIIRDASVIASYANRFTIISNDIAFVLRRRGMTMYKEGLDWTYGFYTRRYVDKRIMRKIERQLLVEAATARAEQTGAAAAEAAQACSGAEAEAEAEAACGAAAAAEMPGLLEEREAEAEAGTDAATAGAASQQQQDVRQQEAAAEQQEAAAEQQEAAAEQQQRRQLQEEATAEATAAAAAALLSPQVQQRSVGPAWADCGSKGSGMPASPAPEAAAERRLSMLPTPAAQPMSKARCLEVQAWMSALMHRSLSKTGFVSQRQLKQAMLAEHPCSAAEVQDVLFALERKGAIMVEGDDVYLC